MQTQAFQLTLYLPHDAAQPAVALPRPDRPRVKDLSIREAVIQGSEGRGLGYARPGQ